MKEILLFLLVISFTLCFQSKAFCGHVTDQQSIEQVASLQIKALPLTTTFEYKNAPTVALGKRKLSTTLRKPITRKWRSRNWNVC